MSELEDSRALRRPTLHVRRLGIDTYREPVAYLRADSRVCRAQGFEAQQRILVRGPHSSIVATLNVLHGELIGLSDVGLSECAFGMLGAQPGERVEVSHPRPLDSMSDVRRKVYGGRLDGPALDRIIRDVAAGRYTDVEIAALVTACSGLHMDRAEIVSLTRAMVDAGESLHWNGGPVLDKHSVGGLPGNRTTPIVVPIITACGFTMPKTSSRAITSAAGTADVMEMLAPVDLDLAALRRVVEREGGCIVWGGAVRLSPADDLLIRVERALDLDGDGQLVASVLSKKVAAGSSHVLIDMPVGPTAKVRDVASSERLAGHLVAVGGEFGLEVHVLPSDGTQPVGHGIGPVLEARDVLAVLHREPGAPADLRERSLRIAGALLECVGHAEPGAGIGAAREVLESGRALAKFLAICEAQGGARTLSFAPYSHAVEAARAGTVSLLDNRRLARIAKLAGAPLAPAAGVDLHVALGSRVERGQPLLTIHAVSPGELAYALDYVHTAEAAVVIEESA